MAKKQQKKKISKEKELKDTSTNVGIDYEKLAEIILLAQKRVVFWYLFYSITPDLFNDLKVTAGLIWGKVIIDTVKERIILSNIDKKALDEIETNISENMMKQKKEYNKLVWTLISRYQ